MAIIYCLYFFVRYLYLIFVGFVVFLVTIIIFTTIYYILFLFIPRLFQDAGASCVKFQKTCLNEKFTKKYLERPYDNANSWGKTYGDHKRHLEFSESQYREIFKYANEIGILCTASAMDMVSVT